MKHLHMLMAACIILLFIYQSFCVLSRNKRLGKPFKIATHIFYALIILSGVMLVMPLLSLNVPLQWVGAKVILLIAAISASVKAFRPTATLAQSKVGIFVTTIAYIGIVALAFIKPANFI